MIFPIFLSISPQTNNHLNRRPNCSSVLLVLGMYVLVYICKCLFITLKTFKILPIFYTLVIIIIYLLPCTAATLPRVCLFCSRFDTFFVFRSVWFLGFYTTHWKSKRNCEILPLRISMSTPIIEWLCTQEHNYSMTAMTTTNMTTTKTFLIPPSSLLTQLCNCVYGIMRIFYLNDLNAPLINKTFRLLQFCLQFWVKEIIIVKWKIECWNLNWISSCD